MARTKYVTKQSTAAGVYAYFDVFCQSGECGQWVEGGDSRAEAVKNARAHGWVFNYRLGWICPECQKSGPVEC